MITSDFGILFRKSLMQNIIFNISTFSKYYSKIEQPLLKYFGNCPDFRNPKNNELFKKTSFLRDNEHLFIPINRN